LYEFLVLPMSYMFCNLILELIACTMFDEEYEELLIDILL